MAADPVNLTALVGFVFHPGSLPSPKRRFPFHARAGSLPLPVPDCHLVRTAIPDLPVSNSLDDFHYSFLPVLILFCRQCFQYAKNRVFPRAVHARQATLHTAFTAYSRVAPQCRFKPAPYSGRCDRKGSTPLHESRSPQRAGRSFHAIETRPAAAGNNCLPPASTPDWA